MGVLYSLGEAARTHLADLARTAAGEWVFAENGADEPIKKNALYHFWLQVRARAGVVADARLHDLRHTHASHAIMGGESLYVTGRMLGHRRPSTTNHYAHLDDTTLSRAAERVAMAIQRKLCHAARSAVVSS